MRRAFANVGVGDSAFHRTVRSGDEALLTRRALDDGTTTIVAVGGDGTWSNVADAIVHSGADCRLALVAAGTGNDFAKSVAVARDYATTARLALDGPDRRVDVGRVETRHFLNAVGFGFDVAVLESATKVRWLKGSLLYAYAALGQLLRYRGIQMARDDDPDAASRLLFVIANGRWFGGAFQIAPHASCDDGLLDAVAVADSSPLGRVQLFVNALRGSHVRLPAVEMHQARTFSLTFPTPPAYQVDGEYRTASGRALSIECLPRALRIVG